VGVHVWQHALEEALLETDPTQMKVKIQRAETAIFGRFERINPGQDVGEEPALYTALGALCVLSMRHTVM
jgi:hypothetical protein